MKNKSVCPGSSCVDPARTKRTASLTMVSWTPAIQNCLPMNWTNITPWAACTRHPDHHTQTSRTSSSIKPTAPKHLSARKGKNQAAMGHSRTARLRHPEAETPPRLPCCSHWSSSHHRTSLSWQVNSKKQVAEEVNRASITNKLQKFSKSIAQPTLAYCTVGLVPHVTIDGRQMQPARLQFFVAHP